MRRPRRRRPRCRFATGPGEEPPRGKPELVLNYAQGPRDGEEDQRHPDDALPDDNCRVAALQVQIGKAGLRPMAMITCGSIIGASTRSDSGLAQRLLAWLTPTGDQGAENDRKRRRGEAGCRCC